MAVPSSNSRGAHLPAHLPAHPAPRPRASMSTTQLQAYFMARETLRRLKPSATPCVARGVTIGGAPPPAG